MLIMINDVELAKEVLESIRAACKILDESAALVRQRAPEGSGVFVTAMGTVFENIAVELLEPLERDASG